MNMPIQSLNHSNFLHDDERLMKGESKNAPPSIIPPAVEIYPHYVNEDDEEENSNNNNNDYFFGCSPFSITNPIITPGTEKDSSGSKTSYFDFDCIDVVNTTLQEEETDTTDFSSSFLNDDLLVSNKTVSRDIISSQPNLNIYHHHKPLGAPPLLKIDESLFIKKRHNTNDDMMISDSLVSSSEATTASMGNTNFPRPVSNDDLMITESSSLSEEEVTTITTTASSIGNSSRQYVSNDDDLMITRSSLSSEATVTASSMGDILKCVSNDNLVAESLSESTALLMGNMRQQLKENQRKLEQLDVIPPPPPPSLPPSEQVLNNVEPMVEEVPCIKVVSQQQPATIDPFLKVIMRRLSPGKETFPMKLHRILLDLEYIVDGTSIATFLPDGKSFVIKDITKFEETVLKLYFPRVKKSFSTFRRQLNMYNFETVKKKSDKGCIYRTYSHPLFIRKQPELAVLMKSIRNKNSNRRASI